MRSAVMPWGEATCEVIVDVGETLAARRPADTISPQSEVAMIPTLNHLCERHGWLSPGSSNEVATQSRPEKSN